MKYNYQAVKNMYQTALTVAAQDLSKNKSDAYRVFDWFICADETVPVMANDAQIGVGDKYIHIAVDIKKPRGFSRIYKCRDYLSLSSDDGVNNEVEFVASKFVIYERKRPERELLLIVYSR